MGLDTQWISNWIWTGLDIGSYPYLPYVQLDIHPVLALIPNGGVKCFEPKFFVEICRLVYVSKLEAIQYT